MIFVAQHLKSVGFIDGQWLLTKQYEYVTMSPEGRRSSKQGTSPLSI